MTSGIWSLNANPSANDPSSLSRVEVTGKQRNILPKSPRDPKTTAQRPTHTSIISAGTSASKRDISYPMAKALYVYDSQDYDELSLHIGDLVIILEDDLMDGWCFGVTAFNRVGFTPRQYLTLLSEAEMEEAWQQNLVPSQNQIEQAKTTLATSTRHLTRTDYLPLDLPQPPSSSIEGVEIETELPPAPDSFVLPPSEPAANSPTNSPKQSSSHAIPKENSNSNSFISFIDSTSSTPTRSLFSRMKKGKTTGSSSSSTSSTASTSSQTSSKIRQNPEEAPDFVYNNYLQAALSNPGGFTDLSQLNAIYPCGFDKEQRLVFVVLGTRLSKIHSQEGEKIDDLERIFQYCIFLLNEMVNQKYILIYVHDPQFLDSMATVGTRPLFAWLRKARSVLKRDYKKNLDAFYIVRPTFWVKMVMNFFMPITSPKFWRDKMFLLPSVDNLFDSFTKDEIVIPPDVYQREALWAMDDLRRKHKQQAPMLKATSLVSDGVKIMGDQLVRIYFLDIKYAQFMKWPKPKIPYFLDACLNYLATHLGKNPADVLTLFKGTKWQIDVDAVITLARMCDSQSFEMSSIIKPPPPNPDGTPAAPVSTKSPQPFENPYNFIFECSSPHVILSLFKRWLRRLTEPLMTTSLYTDIANLANQPNPNNPVTRMIQMRSILLENNKKQAKINKYYATAHWESAKAMFNFLFQISCLYAAQKQSTENVTSPQSKPMPPTPNSIKKTPKLPPKNKNQLENAMELPSTSTSSDQESSTEDGSLDIRDYKSYWLGPMGALALSGKEATHVTRSIQRMARDIHIETLNLTLARQMGIIFAPNLIWEPPSNESLFSKAKDPLQILAESRSVSELIVWFAAYPSYFFAPLSSRIARTDTSKVTGTANVTWISSFTSQLPVNLLPQSEKSAQRIPKVLVTFIETLRDKLNLSISCDAEDENYVPGLFFTHFFLGKEDNNICAREIAAQTFATIDSPPGTTTLSAIDSPDSDAPSTDIVVTEDTTLDQILHHWFSSYGLNFYAPGSKDSQSLAVNVIASLLTSFLKTLISPIIPTTSMRHFIPIAKVSETSTIVLLLNQFYINHLPEVNQVSLSYICCFLQQLAQAAEANNDTVEDDNEDSLLDVGGDAEDDDFADVGGQVISRGDPYFRLANEFAPLFVSLEEVRDYQNIIQTKIVPLIYTSIKQWDDVFSEVPYPLEDEFNWRDAQPTRVRQSVALGENGVDENLIYPDENEQVDWDAAADVMENSDDDHANTDVHADNPDDLLDAVRGLRFSALLLPEDMSDDDWDPSKEFPDEPEYEDDESTTQPSGTDDIFPDSPPLTPPPMEEAEEPAPPTEPFPESVPTPQVSVETKTKKPKTGSKTTTLKGTIGKKKKKAFGTLRQRRDTVAPRMSILDPDMFSDDNTSQSSTSSIFKSPVNDRGVSQIRFSVLDNSGNSQIIANAPKSDVLSQSSLSAARASKRLSVKQPMASFGKMSTLGRSHIPGTVPGSISQLPPAELPHTSSSQKNSQNPGTMIVKNMLNDESSPSEMNRIGGVLPLSTMAMYTVLAKSTDIVKSHKRKSIFRFGKSKSSNPVWSSFWQSFTDVDDISSIFSVLINSGSEKIQVPFGEDFVSYWKQEWISSVSLGIDNIFPLATNSPDFETDLTSIFTGAPLKNASFSVGSPLWIPIVSIPTLRKLDLHGSTLDTTLLGNLVGNTIGHLEWLSLARTEISDRFFEGLIGVFQSLAHSSPLNHLILRDSPTNAVHLSSILPFLPNLLHLDVSLTAVSFIGLTRVLPVQTISNLVTLNLLGCEIDDDSLTRELLEIRNSSGPDFGSGKSGNRNSGPDFGSPPGTPRDNSNDDPTHLHVLNLSFTQVTLSFFDLLSSSNMFTSVAIVHINGTHANNQLQGCVQVGQFTPGTLWLASRVPGTGSHTGTGSAIIRARDRALLTTAVFPTRVLNARTPFLPDWFHSLVDTLTSWTSACFAQGLPKTPVHKKLAKLLEGCMFFDKSMIISNHGEVGGSAANAGVAWGLSNLNEDLLLWSSMMLSDHNLLLVGMGPQIPQHSMIASNSSVDDTDLNFDDDILSSLSSSERCCFWLDCTMPTSPGSVADSHDHQPSRNSELDIFETMDDMDDAMDMFDNGNMGNIGSNFSGLDAEKSLAYKMKHNIYSSGGTGQLFLSLQPDTPPTAWVPLGRDPVQFLTTILAYFGTASKLLPPRVKLESKAREKNHFLIPMLPLLPEESTQLISEHIQKEIPRKKSCRLFIDYISDSAALEVIMRQHPLIGEELLASCLSDEQLYFLAAGNLGAIEAPRDATTISVFQTVYTKSLIYFISPAHLVVEQEEMTDDGPEISVKRPIFIQIDYTPLPDNHSVPFPFDYPVRNSNTKFGTDFPSDIPSDVLSALCIQTPPSGPSFFGEALKQPESQYLATHSLLYLLRYSEFENLFSNVIKNKRFCLDQAQVQAVLACIDHLDPFDPGFLKAFQNV